MIMIIRLRAISLVCMALVGVAKIRASDLVDFIPLTPTVIALHFDDGYVKYHGYHQEEKEDVVVNSRLDTYRATHPYSYHIFSPDDANYMDGRNPVHIGRKSKPTAISDSCIWMREICDNQYVLEHWIYLELPYALERNRHYTIWFGELAENLDEVSFEYNEMYLRSEMVHVNQHGYRPSSRMKFGYLAHWAGDFGPIDLDFLQGNAFYLVNMADNTVAYEGTVTARRRGLGDGEQDFGTPDGWGTTNNVYGSDVWEVDFSAFTTPGEYRLVVEGVGCSYPFSLDENAYREAYYYTARGLYYQRAGIAKEEAYAGRWAQPRDHHPEDGVMKLYYTRYPSVLSGEGDSSRDSILANVVGEITGWGWGWYHDAGDWDGYVHHTDVPYFLLASYELAPQNYRDNELNIPESGNGIPDILDEAGWLINYFRRNQQPEGGIAGGRVNSDFNEKPAASPSYEDARPWYVCGEDPHTSYLFAGLAAQYAYCLEMAGITDSTPALLAEALAAYNWAGENHHIAPEVTVKGATLDDMRMYAAASLFKLTGETAFQDELKALNRVTSEVTSLAGGGYNQTKAVWSFVTCPDHPGIDAGLKEMLSQATIRYAINDFLDPAKKRTGRMGYSWNMPAIVGSTTTPINIAPMFAQHVADGAQKQEFIDYMQTTADYFLGNNPLNTSWITGLGDRRPERMLHLDSRYDISHLDEYVPGLVPYGPMRNGDNFLGEDAQGPWDADFAKIRSYPDRYQWPVSEFWFDSPYSVLDGEFTVHQTNAPAASSYGFLAADTTFAFAPNAPPEIAIVSPASPSTVDEADSLKVDVEVNDDVAVSCVIYYLDHHPVCAEFFPPFDTELPVKDLQAGTFSLRTRVVDNDGMEAWAEGPKVTIRHNYRPAILVSPDADTLAQGQPVDVLVDVAGIPGATVQGVTLYLNGMEEGSDVAPPFQFSIDSVCPLYNEIKAVVSFAEGFESSAKVLKFAVPGVAGVAFKKKGIEIHAGEYETLAYEVFPAEAENRRVTFHSTDESIASVNDQGRVGGVKEGEAQIVVTTEEGSFTDTAAVKVLPPRPRGPYGGLPAFLPALIEAEHYDYGGEGFAYHDMTPGNAEGVYRFEDVDVGQSYDDGATAFHVTGISAGEWLNFTVDAPEDNLYDFRFRYTAGSGEPSITLKADGEVVTSITLPVVGWYPFMDHVAEDIPLKEGEQTLTIRFDNGMMTLNYFEVSCRSCSSIPPREITLNYHHLDIPVGGMIQLAATLIPESATNKRVLWRTPDDGVLFVDQEGNVTALRPGSTMVIAETQVRGLTDTCMVNVVEGSANTPGLNYDYYEGDWDITPDFDTLAPVFTGRISNFDISPAAQEDYFGFRFYGDISIYREGAYIFYTASDDGSLLFIDGVLVVDNDGLHATLEQGGLIELDSGSHQIEVRFFEKEGGAVLQVSYEGPGIEKEAIPDSVLSTFLGGGELVPLEGIFMPDTMTIPVGSALAIPVEFDPANASDRTVRFSSSDPGVAQVDLYGNAKGLAMGAAIITGIARDGGFSDTTTLTVVNDLPLVILLESMDDRAIGIVAVPNPFSDIIQFRISLSREGNLILKVYDLAGTLHHISGPYDLKAGTSVIEWDGRGDENQPLPQGAYLCRFLLESPAGRQAVHHMVIKK
jgi:endoglucanase